MSGSWRATLRMVTAAAAAAAVERVSESLRRLLDEAAPRPGPAAPSLAPVRFLDQPAQPTTTGAHDPAPSGDHVIAAQARPSHEFGPTPVVTPSRGIGFRTETRRAEPVAEMPVISRPPGHDSDEPEAELVVHPDGVHTAASIVQDLDEDPEIDDELDDTPVEDTSVAEDDTTPTPDEIDEEPPVTQPELREPAAPADVPAEAPAEPVALPPKARRSDDRSVKKTKGKHRRHRSAVSGTVRSSRGRGLRGMQVAVIGEDGKVAATAVTGEAGSFVVGELPAGRYRVTVTDEADGDFVPAWHGGSSADDATRLKVKEGKTRRKADVTLVSTAAVALDVDLRKKKAVVGIGVSESATGAPAEGTVRVSTKLFAVDLPLVGGQTSMTLRGSARTTPALSKRVVVDYRGSRHTAPASQSARLR